ncbi:ankyrin, partial [Fusarium oxysporum f. sp. albedinis]
ERGVDLESKDNNGCTPLSRAALHGNDTVVKLLLAKDGVNRDSRDNSGQTPLSHAVIWGRDAVAKLLCHPTAPAK